MVTITITGEATDMVIRAVLGALRNYPDSSQIGKRGLLKGNHTRSIGFKTKSETLSAFLRDNPQANKMSCGQIGRRLGISDVYVWKLRKDWGMESHIRRRVNIEKLNRDLQPVPTIKVFKNRPGEKQETVRRFLQNNPEARWMSNREIAEKLDISVSLVGKVRDWGV